jgi:hypothetical protein
MNIRAKKLQTNLLPIAPWPSIQLVSGIGLRFTGVPRRPIAAYMTY